MYKCCRKWIALWLPRIQPPSRLAEYSAVGGTERGILFPHLEGKIQSADSCWCVYIFLRRAFCCCCCSWFISVSKINFYWNIIALQCCASYGCIAKLISYNISPPFWISFPFRSPQSISRVPVPYSRFSLGIYFVRSIDSVCISIPVSQFIPPPPFPPRFVVHTFALYVCISNSALQIRSIPFFPDSM